MDTNDLCGSDPSWLALGAKKLPLNRDAVTEIVTSAIQTGVKIFEAAPSVMSALASVPRREYMLLAGCELTGFAENSRAGKWVEEQLTELGADYFDFYLLRGINEGTLYSCERTFHRLLGALSEKGRQGKIRCLGFSFTGKAETMKSFLARYGDCFSFCAMQLNYMDWFLQNACEKLNVARKYKMPVLALRPFRGGLLTELTPELDAEISSCRPGESAAAWAMHWLQARSGVMAVLANARSVEEIKADADAWHDSSPLTPAEESVAYYIAGKIRHMENSIPCTGCGHCTGICPTGLDIPYLMGLANDLSVEICPDIIRSLRMMPGEMRPSSCVGCGTCVMACPKMIAIPEILHWLETMEKNSV